MYNGLINERKPMADYFIHETAWVSEDGSFGINKIIHFDENALDEDQWEVLDCLSDHRKFDYVHAVLNNEDLDEWEN